MPSWNIHTAHVERILNDAGPATLGVSDANAFLFGNLAPDIYVGYMVPDITRKIEYRDTHYADPGFIPAPDASLFYRKFVQHDDANDVTLGAWTHLLCDHYYNLRTIEFINRIGVEPGEQTRIRKQGDFDLFGRTLQISRVPQVMTSLVDQCARFPQYPIDEADVRGAVTAAARIVERNRTDHVDGTPEYSLLTPEFFANTFSEVNEVLHEALRAHASGADASGWGAVEQ